MDRKTKFIDHIIRINENELSRNILQPLFSSMFKCRVDFIGGSQEKGKDLIIFKKDDFNFPETIGVQVKKTKPTTNSSSNSLQQIITQLHQIKNEKVIDIETSNPISINKLYFVTPYIIPENILNHAQGAFQRIKNERVHIIDGNMIYEKTLEHMPSIIDSALGDNNSVWESILSKISNEAVLKSLNYKKKKDISDIYCDISFNLNHKKTSRYLEQKITPRVTQLTVADNEKNQRDIDKHNKSVKQLTGSKFFNVEESTGLKQLTLQAVKTISIEEDNIKQLEKELSETFSIGDANIFKEKTASDITNIMSQLQNDLKKTKDIEKTTELNKTLSLGRKLSLILIQILNKKSLVSQIANDLADKKVHIELNVDAFCSFIEKLKKQTLLLQNFSLSEKLKLSSDLSIAFSFLEANENLFKFDPPNEWERMVLQECVASLRTPFSTPIVDILDSGCDVLICGEAGSGKTTNLQAYTLRLYKRFSRDKSPGKFTYYSTLNDIFSVMISKELTCISESIFHTLMGNKNSISQEDFKDKLKAESSTLILDSIDECISSHPDTLDYLRAFKEKYPKSQIVTSSRHSIDKTLSLGFSSISILPFTRSQKFNFFTNWFNNASAAEEIMCHLDSNENLSKIIDNPLNATILAVLYDNGVQLPNSESSLYQRRFELLSGKLDQFKGIQRTANTPDDLMASATFIAYEMQKLKMTRITKDLAISLLSKLTTVNSYSNQLFDELVTPCEIMHVNDNNTFDFGHLKFQEYLASKDIDNRRSENFGKILKDIPWWEQTLFLYAQHARDISWIVNYICNNGLVKKHFITLQKIMALSKVPGKDVMKRQVESAIRTHDEDDY